MTKKNRAFISISLMVLLGGGSVAWWLMSANPGGDNPPEEYLPKSETSENRPVKNGEPLKLPEVKPTPNITIDNLSNGDPIRSGSIARGKVKSPHGVLYISIKGSQSGKISDYNVTVPKSRSTTIPYSVELYFERAPKTGEKGVLDVYTKEDGVRAYSKQVEIVFQ